MCLCSLCADRFLRSVYGTDIFLAYCRARHIPFARPVSAPLGKAEARLWMAALAELTDDQRGRVGWELAAVDELSSREAVTHLLDAAGDADLPPSGIPSGGPLALWFLLHRPTLFRAVFFHHEPRETDAWYTARTTPGLRVPRPDHTAASLTQTLRAFFQEHGGTGRFCTVDAYQFPAGVCFAARVAGRPWLAEGFTDGGKPTRHRLPVTLGVQFVYYPKDGTVLLQSSLRSVDRIRGLLACFGRAALGVPIEDAGAGFVLDRLKLPFHPLPDADDMEMVRVKTIHLGYPERDGRQQLKFETLTSAEPKAMDDLIRAHVRDDALGEFRVIYAELQVRLRVENHSKHYLIRLWPNRCDVGRGPLRDRFLACLRRWGL